MDEKKTRTEASDMPAAPSTIGVVPYYPNLKLAFDRVASCLVFTYLEIHHAAPQDTSGRTASLPVTVDVETVCRDLQMSRRTLALALFPLCTFYREEALRFRAARAAREFLNTAHRRASPHKVYSVVSDNRVDFARSFILRRNLPLIAATLAKCGYSSVCQPQPVSMAISQAQTGTEIPSTCREFTERPARVSPMPASLAEILLKASVLAGDRRSLRYPRLRKAVASGLEDRSVLSAKQPKGRKRNNQLTEVNSGVEPELPEEVAARLMRLRKQGI